MTQKPLVLHQKLVEERAKNYDNDTIEWNVKHQRELKERENDDDVSTNIKAEFKQPNTTKRLNPRIIRYKQPNIKEILIKLLKKADKFLIVKEEALENNLNSSKRKPKDDGVKDKQSNRSGMKLQ